MKHSERANRQHDEAKSDSNGGLFRPEDSAADTGDGNPAGVINIRHV